MANNTTTNFKGFMMVLQDEYDSLSQSDKLNYMWFTRKDSNATTGRIYFGSRLYGSSETEGSVNCGTY